MADVTRHGPFGPDEIESESRMMMHMMVRELDHLLEMDSEMTPDPEMAEEQVPQATGPRTRGSKNST
jgi:hypothetical protein